MKIENLYFICFCSIFFISCSSTTTKIIEVEPVEISYNIKVSKKDKSKIKGTNPHVKMLTSQLCNQILKQPSLLIEGSLFFFNEKNKWPKNFNDFFILEKHPTFLEKIKETNFDKTLFTTMEDGSLKITYIISTENSDLKGSVIIKQPEE